MLFLCKMKPYFKNSISSHCQTQEHGIGMKAGAAFKSSINIELLKMKESGFIAKLKKKWVLRSVLKRLIISPVLPYLSSSLDIAFIFGAISFVMWPCQFFAGYPGCRNQQQQQKLMWLQPWGGGGWVYCVTNGVTTSRYRCQFWKSE